MGQDKNSKTKQDKIAKQKITRKRRKFIDERDLHDKRIEVRLERKKKEWGEKYLFPIYVSKGIANDLPMIR